MSQVGEQQSVHIGELLMNLEAMASLNIEVRAVGKFGPSLSWSRDRLDGWEKHQTGSGSTQPHVQLVPGLFHKG
jgi:hypothetical protein